MSIYKFLHRVPLKYVSPTSTLHHHFTYQSSNAHGHSLKETALSAACDSLSIIARDAKHDPFGTRLM